VLSDRDIAIAETEKARDARNARRAEILDALSPVLIFFFLLLIMGLIGGLQ